MDGAVNKVKLSEVLPNANAIDSKTEQIIKITLEWKLPFLQFNSWIRLYFG